MIFEMLLYFVVLSFFAETQIVRASSTASLKLCNKQYIERIRLPFMPLNFSCMFMFGITSVEVSVLNWYVINNFLMYRYISRGN